MNLLKEEIDHFGDRIDHAIKLSGQEIDDRIEHVGRKLEDAIGKVSDELNTHRNLTKEEIERLILFAADKFGVALDTRIEKLRHESSELITQKVAQVRTQLTEAANEQKRAAVRNASVAVMASILVGAVSLIYKRAWHGEIYLLDVFRSSLLALASGYGAWLLFRYVHGYFQASRFQRNVIVIGLRYFDVLRPKGVGGHVILLFIVVMLWVLLHYSNQVRSLVGN